MSQTVFRKTRTDSLLELLFFSRGEQVLAVIIIWLCIEWSKCYNDR
jgi:hypothetical protein